jgi:hypothetical protein
LVVVLAISSVSSNDVKDSSMEEKSRYYPVYNQPDYYGGATGNYGGATGNYGGVYPAVNNQYGGSYGPPQVIPQPPNYYGASNNYGSHQHHHHQQPTSNPYGSSAYPGSSSTNYYSPPYHNNNYGATSGYGNSPY